MKLENCITYPTVIADKCDWFTNYTVDDDYECVIKEASVGSGSEILPTVYKHAINENICTYAESPACVCGDY